MRKYSRNPLALAGGGRQIASSIPSAENDKPDVSSVVLQACRFKKAARVRVKTELEAKLKIRGLKNRVLECRVIESPQSFQVQYRKLSISAAKSSIHWQ